MQLGIGVIVAIIALAAAAGAAYYVQSQQGGGAAPTTSVQQPTQTPGSSVPVTTSTASATSTPTTWPTSTSSTASTEPTQPETSTSTTQTPSTTITGTSTTSITATSISTTTATMTTTTITTTRTGPETSTTTSPAQTTTTRTTTIHSTTTVPTTTTTQTSTSTTSTTTTTTTQREEIIKPTVFKGYKEFLGNYTKLAVHFKSVRQNEVDEYTLSMKTSKTSNGYKAEITIIETTNGETGSNQTLTLFIDNDLETVNKIVMPNGQVFEGQMAQSFGQQILTAITHLANIVAWVGDIEIGIAEGSYAAMRAGWVVKNVEKTSITISGNTYNAYKITMENKSDKSSDVKTLDFTIAETRPSTWTLCKMHTVSKNGDEYTWEITEMVPWQ